MSTQLSLGKIPFFWSFLFITSFCNVEHLFSFFDGESLNHFVDFSWSWFLDCVMYISEWIVVAWNKCSVVVSLSRGVIIKVSIVEVSVVLWSVIWAIMSEPWFLAFEAESFPEEIVLFFKGHHIDSGGDNIDVHSIWIILGFRLIVVSSLVGWSGRIPSSIGLSKSVGEALLSSHRSIVLLSEC